MVEGGQTALDSVTMDSQPCVKLASFNTEDRMRIAVIEDNVALANGIAHQLRDQGHAVNVLHDGDFALEFVTRDGADLVVLDVNLPGLDGFSVLKGLRKSGNSVPIIMLTARGDLQDRLKGLDAGADDYLIKPFEMEELEARIRALMRRKPTADSTLVTLGPLSYDSQGRRLLANGAEIELPRRELALFECLLERAGQIVSKTIITDQLYGVGAEVEEKVVEVYVSRLRKKLAPFDVTIKTARGLGYMLDLPR